jgi:hypothetical protein
MSTTTGKPEQRL